MRTFFIWLKGELKEHLPIFWEAIKEPLREIVLAVIPGALAYFQAIPETWAVVIYLVLRGIDKWLHERGKVLENESLKAGLTRF